MYYLIRNLFGGLLPFIGFRTLVLSGEGLPICVYRSIYGKGHRVQDVFAVEWLWSGIAVGVGQPRITE